MRAEWLLPLAIVAATVVIMELLAAAVHRYVMHGFGWRWHRSHHEERSGLFEKNDLYAVLFAGISLVFFIAGARIPALWWIGAGMLAYGLLYGLLHDVLVHRRLPLLKAPRRGYLKRLVQAHRLHHAVRDREGCVSFGFIYAPPVSKLLDQLRAPRERA
jgi:beta-carotene 3-hydroxylase